MLVPRWRYRLKEFVVNWFRHYGLGFHAGEWRRLAMVISIALVPGRCLIKTCHLAPYTRTRQRRERERLLAHTWRVNVF